MNVNIDSLNLLYGLLVIFGTVTTFLLGIIAFWIKKFIDKIEASEDKLNNHETRLSVTEAKIYSLEKK